jgi:hypothetical protein
MDATGIILMAIGIAAFIAAMLGFWKMSTACPPGAVLAVGIALYVVSRIVGGIAESRVGYLVISVMGLSGMAGVLLGIFDLRRVAKYRRNERSNHASLLNQTMKAKSARPKSPESGSTSHTQTK